MPQARSRGSGSSSSGGSSGRSGGSSRSKGTGRASTSSRSKTTAGKSTSARSKSTGARAKSTRARSTTSARSTGTARSRASSSTAAADARVDAVAQRLRKLNERIIDAGKEAGETTLTAYEKALKSIASSIERGPGSSDVEWLSNLATAQAKFIRDVTASWTKAAREMLK